jgi:ligand-binding sensor domain-containing protein/two-component sensor histidine kinase
MSQDISRTLRLALWSIFLFLLPGSATAAPEPAARLKQFLHTSTTYVEGRALAVTALAQTAEGCLWVGTVDGLARFDGLTAAAWEPPPGDELPSEWITALYAASDGALWIGSSRGLSRLAQGRLTNYTQAQGLPAGNVLTILEASDGILAGIGGTAGGRLVCIRRGTMKIQPVGAGFPGSVLSLFEDSARNLWIGTSAGLYRRRGTDGGGATHTLIDGPLTSESAVTSITGTAGQPLVFVDSRRGVLSLTDGSPETTRRWNGPRIPVPFKALRGHGGDLWIGTGGHGLFRLRNGALEQYSRRDGLSNDAVTALLEDFEGGLWVGTAAGLDRFSEPSIVRWAASEGLTGNLVTAVLADRSDTIWAGTAGDGLSRLEDGKFVPCPAGGSLVGTSVLGLDQDREGRIWVATTRGLGFLSGGRFIEVRAADGARVDHGFAITHDAAGTVWVADTRLGLLRIRNGQARLADIPELKGRSVYALRARANGELWIGWYEGGIGVLGADGVLARYDVRDGLASGAIHDFFEDHDGSMWVAAIGGLSHFSQDRWNTWAAGKHLPSGGVQAIGDDRLGRLWLTTAAGLIYFERPKAPPAPDGGPQLPLFSVISTGEGFLPRKTRTLITPRMTKSSDGRLWISTEDGLASVAPARIRGNKRAVPIVITRISVDGTTRTPADGEIAFRGKAVEVEYTGVTFTAPEAVRFRYRLDGVDREWVDAGSSRKIVWIDLPPGRHRFQVTAASPGGSWNQRTASVVLHRLPYFHETPWFLVLCLIATLLTIYVLYLLRMVQIRSRFRLVLQERTRLTREIHDSLLQGFAGVVYQLDAASRFFASSPSLAKQKLDRALEQADQALSEARQAITCMRIPSLESNSLPEAVAQMGRQIVDGTSITFDLSVQGTVRQLGYQAQATLYLISREAVSNAATHANPGRISVRIVYSSDGVALSVRDDGEGFDPQAVQPEGHFGLTGMRERARACRASFEVSSRPGHGTVVSVSVSDRRSPPAGDTNPGVKRP